MTVNFAERLRQFRTEKGLSQQQLAVKMMVDRSSIARWENGTRSPDITLMPRLSECLGVDVSDLLNDDSAEPVIPRIILVDDEKPNLTGGLRVLTETLPGAEITGFVRPSEALMFAKSNPVNLAILDIELGRSNGFELCEKLTALHPETNVVFLTAWPEHSLEAWKTDACGFLVKPLLPADVMAILPKLKYPLPDSIFQSGGGNEKVNIGWMDFINLSVGIAGVTMTMLGLLVTLIYRPVDHVMRQYFLLFFSLLIVYTGSIFVGQIVDYLENPGLVFRGSVFLESLSSSLLMPLLTA